MTASSRGNAEVLVHIAGQSKASDDALYRDQAYAYLGFEAAQRTDICKVDIVPSRGEREHGSPRRPAIAPPPRIPHEEVVPASWKQNTRIVEDSCPENDVRLAEFCSPTLAFMQLLQSSPLTTHQEQERHQHRSQSLGFSRRPSPPLESPKRPADGISTTTADPLPDSPVLSQSQPPCPARKRKAGDLCDPDNDPQARPASAGSPARKLVAMQRAESAPVGSLTRSAIITTPTSTATAKGPRFLERTQSDSTSNRASQQPSAAPLLNAENHLGSLLIEPPLPPVSIDHVGPDDLVTAGLAQLEAQLGLSRRFRPEGNREPRPFERGYWLLDLRTYPADLRRTMWVFFGNYIGGGLAGWGVWCSRDGDEDMGAATSVSECRVYCWGRVVGHVWLLIYLASKRKTKETGGVWIGGDGKGVCTVRPW